MDTYNLLPENEYREAEDRRYLTPNLQVDATNTFIDNLRSNQQANNAQITMQTRNLGTQVPSNLGGLTGGTGYFTSRYQTPQTNAATQNLRTAAQAAALNQALANEKAYWQKRYQDAYRAYQKSAYDKENTPTPVDPVEDPKENVELGDSSKTINGVVPGVAGGYTVANIDTETGEVLGYTGVPYGEDGRTNYTTYLDEAVSTPTRQKIVRGVAGNDTTYLHTLPNGNKVAVNEAINELVRKSDGNYVLRNKNTGEERPVGGQQ